MFIHKLKQKFIVSDIIINENSVKENSIVESNFIENRNYINENSFIIRNYTKIKIVLIFLIIIMTIVYGFLVYFRVNQILLYKQITVDKYNINSHNVEAKSEMILNESKTNKILAYLTDKTQYTLCDNKDKCAIVSYDYFKTQIYDESSNTKTQIAKLYSISFENLLKYKSKDNKENINYYGNVKEITASHNLTYPKNIATIPDIKLLEKNIINDNSYEIITEYSFQNSSTLINKDIIYGINIFYDSDNKYVKTITITPYIKKNQDVYDLVTNIKVNDNYLEKTYDNLITIDKTKMIIKYNTNERSKFEALSKYIDSSGSDWRSVGFIIEKEIYGDISNIILP